MLHDVPLDAVLRHVRDADPLVLAAVVALATLTFPLRTMRWRVILRSVDGRPLPWLPLWHATAIGFMANNLLPARAGEVARAFVAKRGTGVRFTTAVASIGVERVFDGLMLVVLMTVALVASSFPRDARVGGTSLATLATGAAIVFTVALLAALALVHWPAPTIGVLRRVLQRVLPERLAGRAVSWIEGLVAGLTVLKSPRRFGVVVLWSLLLWLVNAASFALCYRAFALPLPPESALLLQGVIGFGVAIPSSPGFFGPFEAATRVTLALYGVSPELAVSYAVAYHVATFVPITALGLYSLSRAHVRLGELRRPPAGVVEA